MYLVTLLVEVVGLGAHGLGEGHQLRDALIAVVPDVVSDPEVAEVRQRPAAGMVDRLDHTGQPGAVRREAAVVLDDHVHLALGRELGQPPQPVRGELALHIGSALRARVHAN